MKPLLRSIIILCCLAPTMPAMGQMTLVFKRKPTAIIVCQPGDTLAQRAAGLLNKFVYRISGTKLPVSPQTRATGKGQTVRLLTDAKDLPAGGFRIDCTPRTLTIQSGSDRGVVYGVATLLEQYLGVNYWAAFTWSCPSLQTLALPAIHTVDHPAFSFRQTQSYGSQDADYTDWYRLNTHEEVFAGDLWVHTFNRLLPASRYGKAHPEWYSFLNGQRRPGDHSQWCLTNPEVFEAACRQIDSIFKANPKCTMMSVSQNDGNNTYCQCPQCRQVDSIEGSPSGNLIRFVNKLARRFPDKQFSTLAYLYSMQPPKHVRPLPNVNIMLCDIDCKREVPLTDNESGKDFVRAIEGWSRISDNIFVWDYGINFDNMVAPFPNFHILQPNLQLFKRNHARMVFEQVNGQLGTDFSELRAYMIGKLMWNPNADTDSLMQVFLKGYYGKAAPELYQYLKLQQGALLASRVPLWIYDSPISHKNGMLNDACVKAYNQLFDRAEQLVANDTARLRRVQIARLPLQYSQLEISRTKTGLNADSIGHLLQTFQSRADRYRVRLLNERNNLVDDYCALYRQRYMPRPNTNKAAGATVAWNNPPAQRYQPIADKALTDGLYGGTTYVESWVGWEGKDADFTLDMGSEKTFSSISTDFLHQLGAWVLLPKSVTYYYSADNKNYRLLGAHEFPEDRDNRVKFVKGTVTSPQPVSARYVRVVVKTIGLCPSWHYGVGYPAWFFLDEVEVE